MYALLVDENEHSRTHISVSFGKHKNLYGLTSDLGTDKDGYRKFRINLFEDLSYKKLMNTIAHELTHVKQFMREELDVYHNGHILWKNELIDEKDFDYLDLPYEIEARGYEFSLTTRYELFKKHLKKSKNSPDFSGLSVPRT